MLFQCFLMRIHWNNYVLSLLIIIMLLQGGSGKETQGKAASLALHIQRWGSSDKVARHLIILLTCTHLLESEAPAAVSQQVPSYLTPPCVCVCVCVCVLVAQSCLTHCDPVDCSPAGSSVHAILQARIQKLVAISLSRGSSWPKDWTQISCIAGRFYTIQATREACPLLSTF